MQFTLYTLPTCGICHMVKTKLEEKNIQYEEKSFEEIASYLQTDHAPALKIVHDKNVQFITSPAEMVKLINNYAGWG